MRRALTALVLVPTLFISMSTGNDSGGSDLFAGTDHDTVVVSGSWTESGPNGGQEPSTSLPGGPADSPAPPACDPNIVRISACGFDAVRVTAPEGRPVTITDVAAFAPDAIATVAEPDNLGIAGLPTNFVAAATGQTRTGDLFGRPVTVRFTPVGYTFEFGDGSSASTDTGGQTWSSLGQARFTPTATSHTYRDRGTYAAHVTVHYSAEVDLGGGWFSVPGVLDIAGPLQEIRIFEARTALVAFTCAQRPTAPGC